MYNRRTFLVSAALLSAGALAPAAGRSKFRVMSQKLDRIGLQLFTVPGLVDRGLPEALKAFARYGYREIEFFGPYPFSPAESIEGWKPIAAQLGLKQNAYYGHSPAEVRKMMDDNGLASPSMHADLLTIRRSLEQAAEAAQQLGQRYIIVPAVRTEGVLDNLDAFRRLADEFNDIGRRAKALGIRFAYHNHGYEQAEIDGRVPLDLLLDETDPALVDFELDIYWMIAGGGDPAAFLRARPGRFRLLHLKDMKSPVRFSGAGRTPEEWMAMFPHMADPGSGVLDLPEILTAALASGVQHFYVERDLAPEPEATLRKSHDYLAGLDLGR